MSAAKKLSLTSWILISLIGGVIVGLIFHYIIPFEFREAGLAEIMGRVKAGELGMDDYTQAKAAAADYWANHFFIDGLFKLGADIFIRTLKMLVVPLVFVSLICGVAALGDPQKLGRIGGKTVGLYILTTTLAITLALLAANAFGVGVGAELNADAAFKAKEAPALTQVIADIFPTNPIRSMADGKMLQVIFFAILFGLAISLLKEKSKDIKKFMENINEIIMKMVTILMGFAPIGVFSVVCIVFAQKGVKPIGDLLVYFLVMVGVLLLHAGVTYSTILVVLGKLNPIRFFENIRPAAMLAFSTASSNATLPVTMETVEKHHGVDNSVASFSIPLGATINMDGTAIMQGVATVFIANAAGIDLTMTQYLMVILTATLASVGTAGVPGVGMITLAMVLKQAGLPEEGILLLLPVDRILDMCRTTVNICGDAAVTCVVAKSEGLLNQKIYDQPLGEHYGEYHFNKED